LIPPDHETRDDREDRLPGDAEDITRRARIAESRRQRAIMPGAGRWIWLAVLLAALTGGALAFAGFPDAGFRTLNDAGRVLPDRALATLTELGNTAVLAAMFGLAARRHPQALYAFVVATLAGAVLINGLKDAFDLMRPPALLNTDAIRIVGEAYRRGSFPSGHTFSTFAAAGVALCFLGGAWRRGAVLLLAVIVGSSRVMVGVHWPVDIAAGAVGGLVTAWLSVLVTRYVRFGYRPAVQIAMLWLVVISNLALVWNGSNYDLAAPAARTVAVAATIVLAWQHLGPGRHG
jgi:membrane-associated phospholipid phosphatase